MSDETDVVDQDDELAPQAGDDETPPDGSDQDAETPLDVPDQREVPAEDITVELTEESVVELIAERDEYLDGLQRLKAEFANFRRRSDERASSQRQQAAADLVERLLPVLDSCDAALDQGVEAIKPIRDALFDVLAGQGLTRVDPVGEPFDPEQHEAVMHEDGDGDQVVTQTLRTGYAWHDRVLRAAMVKVQG